MTIQQILLAQAHLERMRRTILWMTAEAAKLQRVVEKELQRDSNNRP